MKNFILLLTALCGAFSLSLHAAIVAESTSELTLNFTYGRPGAYVYLCKIILYGAPAPGTGHSPWDKLTFPDGNSINGIGGTIEFTPETAPISSTLHLGSPNYGTVIYLEFCRGLQIPFPNPGGFVDTFYKIQTPDTWDFFANAQVIGAIGTECSDTGLVYGDSEFTFHSNSASEYTLSHSIPFGVNEIISANPSPCRTVVTFREAKTGPRTPGETTGNVTVGVKDVINYNTTN